MLKATGSRKNLAEHPFYICISDIIENDEILRLNKYTHHFFTTRFQHCLNVSYYNYLICRFFRLDAFAAARAGMMHDMYYYGRCDYHKLSADNPHCRNHPRVAVKNAKKQFYISHLEKDMIEKHMWPFNIKRLPKYRESYVIVVVDKYCAVLEVIAPKLRQLRNIMKNDVQ